MADTADTNFLDMAVDALFSELHQGLVEDDPVKVDAAARAAEQRWAFAAARRERSNLRVLNAKLTQAAMTAEAVAGVEPSGQRWSHRWKALAEAGELVLTADTEAVTGEDRELLRRFHHAESVIEILQQRHIATVATLQEDLALSSVQTCWNHLSRLVRHGLLVRLSEGVYGLSPRGERVAERLTQERSTQEAESADQSVLQQAAKPETTHAHRPARHDPDTGRRQVGWLLDGALTDRVQGDFRREERHLTKVFKALSDGTRQEILRLLEGQQSTVAEIVGNLNVSQPAVSRHLSVLKEADLIVDQRRGQDITYRLNDRELSSSMWGFFGQFQGFKRVKR